MSICVFFPFSPPCVWSVATPRKNQVRILQATAVIWKNSFARGPSGRNSSHINQRTRCRIFPQMVHERKTYQTPLNQLRTANMKEDLPLSWIQSWKASREAHLLGSQLSGELRKGQNPRGAVPCDDDYSRVTSCCPCSAPRGPLR